MAQSQIPMMTYTEYKRLRSEGKILAGISNSDAIRLIEYLPKRYQYAHLFWSWVWMLSIPGFIAVSIFYRWWIGLLMLFIVTPMISRAIKKSAAEFVLEHAEGDAEFFSYLVEKNLLILKPA
jgi:hypothetical protein